MAAAIIVSSPQTMNCTVTRSRTSTGQMPFSWAGWPTGWWNRRGGLRRRRERGL